MKQILLLIVYLISILAGFACNRTIDKKNISLVWESLSTQGLDSDLAKGVSAAYVAYIDDRLIVAGGANFPEDPPYKDGSKVLYDEIMLYDEETCTWIEIGRLHHKSAYGVSIATRNNVFWIGGNTDFGSLNESYKVLFNNDNTVRLESFISLPISLDNFAGCSINNQLFVGGGNADGRASNCFYTINLDKDEQWIRLSDFPGLPRVQPTMSSLEIGGKIYIYLMGGFFGGDSKNNPYVSTDVLRYDVQEETWEVVAVQEDEDLLIPFSLVGSTSMSYDNRYIVCFGGVDYDIFLNAITSQYNIEYNSELSDDSKKALKKEFSEKYLTQSQEYYNFSKKSRVFDSYKGTWRTIDQSSNVARAGATIVYNKNKFWLVQGELKPGVRSPQTWMGTIHTK